MSEKSDWAVRGDGLHIDSSDFAHDVSLRITGDFADHEQRLAYAHALCARLNSAPQPPSGGECVRYDAGLLSDYGGGNVEWWQDYIRAELERAHDFYTEAYTAPPSAPVGVEGLSPIYNKTPTEEEARAAIGTALDDAAKALRVLSTMLKKERLAQGYAVADEILGSIGYATKLNAALAQQPAVDAYCFTREDGECVSDDPRCIHNKPAAVDGALEGAALEVAESINRFRDEGTRPHGGTLTYWEATLRRALAAQPGGSDNGR